MAKIDITRTELVWPGKYNEDGTRKEVPRVNLPFQVIEAVNTSRVDRDPSSAPQITLFDVWKGEEGSTFEDGWKNKLIWGDNLLVMSSLLENFAGQIDLIYIDPPFATGADFTFNTQIGEGNLEATKEHSVIEEKAYRDTWGKGLQSYLGMIMERLYMIKKLLSNRGTLYLHVDHRVVAHVKIICDEIFGEDNFRNVVTWRRQVPRGMKAYARFMPYSSDFILMYSRGEESIWNSLKKEILISISEAKKKYKKDKRGFFRTSDPGTYSTESIIRLQEEGRIYVSKGGELVIKDGNVSTTKGTIGIKYYREYRGNKVVEEKTVDNIWDDIPGLGITPLEYLGYPTQKPEALLERILTASTMKGSLVADFFCGSGTTLSVAEKLGRRWIGCDLSRWAVHVSRKRLLEVENCKPFEILNLGKYERKYWQGVTFKDKDKADQQMAIYQYIAFILRLYSAEPLSGMEHLHGKKGSAVVHVGAVDAPVTIDEIRACIEECARLKLTELHIVGWEWEMGLAGPNNDYRRGGLMHDAAREEGIKLYLFQIPREVMEQQAVDKGDIQFFELAYLESKVTKPEKLTVQVALEDFVIPNSDLIPDEIRQKIKKWSDYIDYWAVDWNFQNDTFIQGWVTYRTRRDRSLKLTTERHTYEKAGKYRILLKVIDIFGNDTSQPIDVEVT